MTTPKFKDYIDTPLNNVTLDRHISKKRTTWETTLDNFSS